ncbi:MAG: hypothetical protein K6C33_09205 [Desulfovibrio sp.]|nr:hypothetical protein [Desulfovibrio sp.]
MPELHEPAIKRVDLDGATFHGASFAPARVSFFYGRNGTGKSTAARAIAGKAGLSWRGVAARPEDQGLLLRFAAGAGPSRAR